MIRSTGYGQMILNSIEEAVRDGLISDGQAGRFIRFYEDGLGGYTYLEESTVPESS